MKLKFKIQPYQTAAVEAVADCFLSQPKSEGISYRIDPGRGVQDTQKVMDYAEAGFRNADIALPPAKVLKNIQEVQRRQNLPQSTALVSNKVSQYNLDVEMETGTGKTYCYIKSMFELNQRYGWSKFIVVVPSIAIREGVYKSLQITAEHFLEQYGKRARFFIYNSTQLHNLESFSSDGGLNVMIINVQAFNARGKDARRIYEELDDFQSRRPIDVIAKNRPILIIDEPQKIEGAKGKASKSFDSLQEFNPLMILRYSATHKKEHNKIHRLDALDAFNQKLVKKIDARGVTVKGLTGTNAYLYLESIQVSPTKPPEARVELEIKQASGIKRVLRKLRKRDNLHDLSNGLDQYDGFVVSGIDARDGTVTFTNGEVLQTGEATGDVNESQLRRIQIREAIKAHLEKEQQLHDKGIKVLTLFFIDEVAKYRTYVEGEAQPGEYATIFEEEYVQALNEVETLDATPYNDYLKRIDKRKTHNGYFSIDKKTKQLKNPAEKKSGDMKGESDDADAYDLILKDKERLLSMDEPVRFIFSHSALREGWDNPNVFVICTLKHRDNTIARRQEVGRGLRLCVDQTGDRIDNPAIVHNINVLTVVANESYKDFVSGLQRDISETLSARPRVADEKFFTGKVFKMADGDEHTVTPEMAKEIYRYLLKNDFTDSKDHITQAYHDAKRDEDLPPLPDELKPFSEQVFQLIDSVYSDAQLPQIDDHRSKQTLSTNANFEKAEFKELWNRINRQAAYSVQFDSDELVGKCIACLNDKLRVAPLQYFIQRGEQREEVSYEELQSGDGFVLAESSTGEVATSASSVVKYDLIGNLAEATQLRRSTIAEILKGLNLAIFNQFKKNPEDFLAKAAKLINEQKATVIIEHLSYSPLDQTHSLDIFTSDKTKHDLRRGVKAERHIYDYVITDSNTERDFVAELDSSTEVAVYSKLPKGFHIPTPVGNYNPDWAIAFQDGKVRHVYFIAETKGSMSSLELREIEKSKIQCARRFFANISKDQVKYEVVDSYSKLMELVS